MLARLLLAATAFVGLTAYTDAQNRFTIDFPAEWGEPTIENGIAIVKGPDGKSNCNAYTPELAALAAMTQEQINAEMAKEIDGPTWAGLIGTTPDNVELIEGDVVEVGGTYMQIATLKFKAGGMAPIDMMSRIAVILKPGYAINAGCYATVEDFEKLKDTFNAAISSLKPT